MIIGSHSFKDIGEPIKRATSYFAKVKSDLLSYTKLRDNVIYGKTLVKTNYLIGAYYVINMQYDAIEETIIIELTK